MYVTVRSYPGNRELADALGRHRDDVERVIRGIGGFRAYYLVRTDDGALTISVFDDRDGADESSRAAAGWLRENLPELSVSPPQITTGEVVIGVTR